VEVTVLRDYDDVVTAFKARMDEIGLSTSAVDDLRKCGGGYVGKLLGPSRTKMFGFISFFELAEILALKVVVEPDLEAAKRMEGKWEKRDELRRRPGVIRKRFSPEVRAKIMSELGRIGGSTPKRFRLSKEQRSRINRRNGRKGGRPRQSGAPPSVKSQSGSQSFGMP
jgi:hypothetical protein